MKISQKVFAITATVTLAFAAWWIATAPNAEATLADNPLEMEYSLHQVAKKATKVDETQLRELITSTYVVATGTQCQTKEEVPVLGYAYYDHGAERPVICVSNWRAHNARNLIVWSHEVAHILENHRDHNHFNDPHDMSHYNSTYDVLVVAIKVADISTANSIRLKTYYKIGTAIAPFKETF
jgi:hypothetical protein